jgi:predicted nucleic acid-binding protein
MTAYLDSSVLLRIVLGQPGRLKEWPAIGTSVASALVEVECLRTLDRIRLTQHIRDEELAAARDAVYRLLVSADVIDPDPTVLRRAAQPLPTALGTLDAIHLATAMLWQEGHDEPLALATHDAALATAARACGLRVIGV